MAGLEEANPSTLGSLNARRREERSGSLGHLLQDWEHDGGKLFRFHWKEADWVSIPGGLFISSWQGARESSWLSAWSYWPNSDKNPPGC